MDKVWLLITQSETGFQSFVLAICHWEMNPDQDADQTSIKMLQENWWNAIRPKVIDDLYLTSTHPNSQYAIVWKR